MMKINATGLLLTAMTTAANAQNMFAFMGDQDATNTIIIEPLNAESDGYVAVYDHHTGEVGELLGVARVYEGANRQLRVQWPHYSPIGRPAITQKCPASFSAA